MPFDTQVSSVFIFKQIESDNATGAAAVSVVLLLVSLLMLIGLARRSSTGGTAMTASPVGRLSIRVFALGYLALLLLVPVGVVLYRTFEPGVGAVIDSITTPAAVSAFWLTIEIAAIAVPLNTIFGIVAALRARARADPRQAAPGGDHRPAVRDLAGRHRPRRSFLLYGRTGWLGPTLTDARHPGHLQRARAWCWRRSSSACRSSCARSTPVLREIGDEQEQAAATLGASRWQTFWRITLPAIRWGVAYGVVLSTARAIGEFGAVSVVSGQDRRRDESRCRCSSRTASRTSTWPAPTRRRRCWP